VTLGGDKSYDTHGCAQALRAPDVTPQVAQNTAGPPQCGGWTHHPRTWLRRQPEGAPAHEEIFGWMKTMGGFRKTRYRGLERVDFAGYLVATAYNLVRLVRWISVPTSACGADMPPCRRDPSCSQVTTPQLRNLHAAISRLMLKTHPRSTAC
jgi:hypothetical protein